MSKLLLSLVFAAALTCLVLSSPFFVQAFTTVNSPSFLFATTFSSHSSNSSIVQVNTTDGSFIKTSDAAGGSVIDSFNNVAFDSVSRTLFLVGISGMEGFIDMFDADTLKLVNQVYIVDPNGVPADVQFDSKLQALFGVAASADGQRFTISQYNLKNGQREEVIQDMPEVEAIDEYCLVYDNVNHYYYVSAITSNATLGSALYKFNMVSKQLEKRIPVPDFIQNAEIDTRTNMLYGVTSDDLFASLDLTTGKYTVYSASQLNLSAVGFRELGASGIDVNNGYYYVLYNNHQAQTHLIKVNYKKLVIESVWPWYNHIGNSIFVPGSTSFSKL